MKKKQTIYTESKYQPPNYIFDATIDTVYDGDTFKILISVGYETYVKTKIRLWGLDTPESRGKNKCQKGIDVKNMVKEMFNVGQEITVRTLKKGKYGRYLAIIWVPDHKGNMYCFNTWLIDNGYAKLYYGGKR